MPERFPTKTSHEPEATDPNRKYPWQQTVADAFQSAPENLPLKVNAAQRPISARHCRLWVYTRGLSHSGEAQEVLLGYGQADKLSRFRPPFGSDMKPQRPEDIPYPVQSRAYAN